MAKQKEIPTDREGRMEYVREQVIEAGRPVKEVAEELDVHPITASMLKRELEIGERGSVTARNDGELGKKIAKLRDTEGHSWHDIMVLTDNSMTRVKRLYTEATGAKPSGRTGAAKSKSNGGTKAKAKTTKPSYAEMSNADLKSSLPGKTVNHSGTKYKVKEVSRVGKRKDGARVAAVVTEGGETVKLPLAEIK